jgi:hypothetical protein
VLLRQPAHATADLLETADVHRADVVLLARRLQLHDGREERDDDQHLRARGREYRCDALPPGRWHDTLCHQPECSAGVLATTVGPAAVFPAPILAIHIDDNDDAVVDDDAHSSVRPESSGPAVHPVA